jgi:cell division protein FtsZ
MIESSMKGVEFWIMNTDFQAMWMSPIEPEYRLQIGQELTRGLGAGSDMVFVMVSTYCSSCQALHISV